MRGGPRTDWAVSNGRGSWMVGRTLEADGQAGLALDGTGCLFLHEAVQFEPVGASAVARARLGHADEEALAQAAGLARRPVLLVDDALAAVLALGDHRQVVVRTAEERLKKKTGPCQVWNRDDRTTPFRSL